MTVQTIGNNGKFGNQWQLSFTPSDEAHPFAGMVGIAYWLVRKYSTRKGADREELLQVALIGILKALNDFDPSKGFRLSTLCFRYAAQACLNSLRVNGEKAYSVRGDGKTSFIDLFCKLKPKYQKFGYDLHELRSQGLESVDSIPPKGEWIFFATEPAREMTIAKTEEEITHPDEGMETEDFVNAIIDEFDPTPRERAILELRLGGEATLVEVLSHPSWEGATKMGVKKAQDRILEKLNAIATAELG